MRAWGDSSTSSSAQLESSADLVYIEVRSRGQSVQTAWSKMWFGGVWVEESGKTTGRKYLSEGVPGMRRGADVGHLLTAHSWSCTLWHSVSGQGLAGAQQHQWQGQTLPRSMGAVPELVEVGGPPPCADAPCVAPTASH